MGLGINYARLDDVLLQLYMDEDHIAERATQAKTAIMQAVKVQTGVESSYPNEPSPPIDLEASRLGPYSAVHLLRIFAARVAGYTLDEAYELDVDSVSPSAAWTGTQTTDLIPEGSDDEVPDADGDSGEDSPEADFQAFYGVEIDSVLPVSPDKVAPFPYYNLVCFSDTEGIYVPLWFPRPIEVDGIFYVGSAVRLHEELAELETKIDTAMDAQGPSDSPSARYRQAVVELCGTLRQASERAVEHSISVVFE